MTQIKPISSMTTPRYADVATFFRLPIIKDLSKLDYCICGVPWDGGTTNRPGARHGPREVRNSSSLVRLYHPRSLKSPYDKSPCIFSITYIIYKYSEYKFLLFLVDFLSV